MFIKDFQLAHIGELWSNFNQITQTEESISTVQLAIDYIYNADSRPKVARFIFHNKNY